MKLEGKKKGGGNTAEDRRKRKKKKLTSFFEIAFRNRSHKHVDHLQGRPAPIPRQTPGEVSLRSGWVEGSLLGLGSLRRVDGRSIDLRAAPGELLLLRVPKIRRDSEISSSSVSGWEIPPPPPVVMVIVMMEMEAEMPGGEEGAVFPVTAGPQPERVRVSCM